MVVLEGIMDNPLNMGKIDNYIEIDSLEDCCKINPHLIVPTLCKLDKQGLVNINRDLVKITNKGIKYIKN